MSRWIPAFLALALVAPVLAQDKFQLIVNAQPAVVDLSVNGMPVSKSKPDSFDFVRSQVVQGGRGENALQPFQFSAPGYGKVEKMWSWNQLKALKLPYKVTLPVASLGALWQRYTMSCSLALLALLGGSAVIASRLQKSRQLAEKDRKLQALTADADVRDHFIMTTLGGYRLVSRLGAGGMALVYKGVPSDTLDESAAVAIKIIKPEEMNKEFEERFKREIRVSMKLNHPNVVRVVTWGQQEGLHYLVMELVDGKPLSSFIPERGMPLEDVKRFAPPIFDSLAYAHKQGIVHRDLKPDNIMVTHKGLVKLMDFGLARNREVKTVTVTGSVMGTPQYMAPEQIMSGPRTEGLDDRSDQYALGCMLFEMLCGRRPFEHDEPMKIIMMHLTADPPALSTYRAGLPTTLEAFIARLLVKDPNDRFPSMQEAGQAFERAIGGVARTSAPLATQTPAKPFEPIAPGATVGVQLSAPAETVGIATAPLPAGDTVAFSLETAAMEAEPTQKMGDGKA